ncbi:hypothetical protein FACS189443_0880 [Planctomycetales bacterium]|nr:hypothetical protein FACS189443_0880 [Planctomycetales bacterium]
MVPYYYALEKSFYLSWRDELSSCLNGLAHVSELRISSGNDKVYACVKFKTSVYFISECHSDDTFLLSIEDAPQNWHTTNIVKNLYQALCNKFYNRKNDYALLDNALLKMSTHIIYLGGVVCEVMIKPNDTIAIEPAKNNSAYKGCKKQ